MRKRPYPPDYPIAHTEAEFLALVDEGLADIEAGRVSDSETVRRTLDEERAGRINYD